MTKSADTIQVIKTFCLFLFFFRTMKINSYDTSSDVVFCFCRWFTIIQLQDYYIRGKKVTDILVCVSYYINGPSEVLR